jgi:hypothetical protein
MHPTRQALHGALLCALALAGCGDGRGETAQAGPPRSTPSTAPRDSLLSPVVPPDASFPDNPSTLDALQHDFDVYSWKTFVALNWPVGAGGQADGTQTIGAAGDNATVWETYKESYEVFLPSGVTPYPWGSPRSYPAACQGVAAAGTPVFRMLTKAPQDVLDVMQEPFQTGPLIDQDSNYVRYAIHINRDAFEFIVRDSLYNAYAQTRVDSVRFPSGDLNTGVTGAIVIKSAWKVLSPGDPPGRFHKSQVLVYTAPGTDPVVRESCVLRTVGLVGFHVAHKTQSAPQWLWSTFEQVDNVRVPPGSGLRASFNNPACTTCPVNQPLPPPWNPDVKGTPSQITRVIPIDSATMALNAEWQGRLRAVNDSSVWQYYELVSTQWPTANPPASLSGPNPMGNPAPQFLANTTLETYVQGRVPNVSSSCIGCHNNATTTNAVFSDFSFLLERAQSVVAAGRQGGN